jgi:hypothetical protein
MTCLPFSKARRPATASGFVGIAKTQLAAYLVGTAYNLLRMARLQPATG